VGSVHQGPVNRKGNELQVAKADLTRALRRVAKTQAGQGATFTQLEVAALEAADEAFRDYYVGTVSFVDEEAESLVTRKYFATHDQGPEAIIKRMMSDIREGRRQRPELSVGIVQDGAKELWKLVRGALKEQLGIEDQKEGIDRYHRADGQGAQGDDR
jgi:hypothetical protein